MKKPFSPETWTEEAKSISDEWASLEDDLLKYQSNRLCENANVDIDEWLLKKLMNPKATISDITNIINRHKPIIDSITKKSLDTAADYAKEYVTSTLNVSISRQDLSSIKNVLDENNNMYNVILTKNVQAANTLPSLVRNEYKLANGNKVFTMEKATETLYKAISKVTDRELSSIIGVNYKDSRKVSFKSYMEMRVRTDINNVAIDMMERASSSLGVVLFLASYFGDCAPDHKDYQGKVYILENWRSIVAQKDIEKYQTLIDRKGIQTLEWVKEQGTYTTDTGKKYLIGLGTRPNCRHTFTPITYDQACNEKKTLEELNLKYHGGYDKGKYGNMQQARFNERKIRDLKLKHQETLAKIANCQDVELKAKYMIKANDYASKMQYYWNQQRNLISRNSYLTRLYKRENPNRLSYNLGVNETLTKGQKNVKIIPEQERKQSSLREGIKPVSEKRFNDLMIEAKKKGFDYVRGESWVEEHLDNMQAGASVLGGIMLFRKDATISEVLEEMHHAEQNKLKMNDDKPYNLREILNEIDAKEYLLRVAKKYSIPRSEIEETKKHLEHYRNKLKDYEEGK